MIGVASGRNNCEVCVRVDKVHVTDLLELGVFILLVDTLRKSKFCSSGRGEWLT